jgi:MraZ protein
VVDGGKIWEKSREMFYGEYGYKIDEKGRVPVPPKFRGALKDGVVLTPGAEKCITAYTAIEWKKLSTSLTGNAITRSKMRKLSRALFATAFHTGVDGQGRIPIPAPLREHAGIADEVVMAGANNYFEIWDKAAWEAEKKDSQEQAWQIIESLENT